MEEEFDDEEIDDDLDDDFEDDDFEDDEMDDVWDAEEDDDDDDFSAGESQVGGFTAPAAAGAAAPAPVFMGQEEPWGALWTSFVSVGAVLSAVCAFVGVEMVRTMWLWAQPGDEQNVSGLLGMLGGMFGS